MRNRKYLAFGTIQNVLVKSKIVKENKGKNKYLQGTQWIMFFLMSSFSTITKMMYRISYTITIQVNMSVNV
jgi:hypothetical protein